MFRKLTAVHNSGCINRNISIANRWPTTSYSVLDCITAALVVHTTNICIDYSFFLNSSLAYICTVFSGKNFICIFPNFFVSFNHVIGFAPTFRKYPLQPNLYGIIGGNITLLCQPEAAPQAEKEWLKDGAPFSPSTNSQDRVTLLSNGNIHIRGLVQHDQGEYQCTATNEHGSDSTTGKVTVLRKCSILCILPQIFKHLKCFWM